MEKKENKEDIEIPYFLFIPFILFHSFIHLVNKYLFSARNQALPSPGELVMIIQTHTQKEFWENTVQNVNIGY